MSKNILNSDVDIIGKLSLLDTSIYNGDFLTINNLNEVTRRTPNILEYINEASLPVIGLGSTLYITTSDNKLFRWDGDSYELVGGGGGGNITSVFGRIGPDIVALEADYEAFYSKLGHTHSQYLLNTTDTLTGNLTVTGATDANIFRVTSPTPTVRYIESDNSNYIWETYVNNGNLTFRDVTNTNSRLVITNTQAQFSGNTIVSGYISASGGNGHAVRIIGSNTGDSNVGYYSIYESNGSTRQGGIGFFSGSNSDLNITNDVSSTTIKMVAGGGSTGLQFIDSGGTGTVWTSRNDGSGSGLDADLFDGINSDGFARLNTTTGNAHYLFLNRNGSTGQATLHVNQEGTGDIANFRKAAPGVSNNSISVVIDNNANITTTGMGVFKRLKSVAGVNGSPVLGAETNSALILNGASSTFGLNFTVNGNGNSRIQAQRFDSTTNTYTIELNPLGGDVTTGANLVVTGNITANSDKRLKKFIRRIPDALNKINQLNGYTYQRKDSGQWQTGLMAHEVRKVAPFAVEEADDKKKTLSVAYGNLAGLFVEAIKELKEIIEKQQIEINGLRTKISC